MMTLRSLVLALLFFTILPPHAFGQIEVNVFDVDGTLFEHRQTRDGAFNPKFVLYRNEQRLNLLQPLPAGPKTVIVTEQDLHKIRDFLAAGEGRPGAVGRVVELQDGSTIRPGEYYLRYPDSFQYFREGEGRNHLLEAFIEAETKSPDGKWKGTLWDYFTELCSTLDGAKTVAILTARGHSLKEWDEFFDYLLKRRHIKFKPSIRHVYGVTRPEFDRYSNHGGAWGGDHTDIPTRKANVVYEILMQLARTPTGTAKHHIVRVAEDDPPNLERIASVFQKVGFGNQSPTRMILINAGTKSQIRESARPEFAVIEPSSSRFTSISRDQAFLDHRAPRSCESLFVPSLKGGAR